ncbi:hypothetical protein BD769DRAFT_1388841 [Suillus cothurnatus]|nr:hypothetical protein BD769DRAFT_1388841 [Suillus cothurnatus]
MSINLRTINSGSDFVAKTLNTFPLATSCFLGNPLNILLQLQLIAWQQDVQDASAINWYNDPNDDTPMLPLPPPPTSNGKLTTFMSHRSGQAIKPTEKIHDAANTGTGCNWEEPSRFKLENMTVVRRVSTDQARSELEIQQADIVQVSKKAIKRSMTRKVLRIEVEDDEKEAKDNNKEEAYKRTKAFGDENHKDHKHKKKEEHSGDLKGVFTQEKGRINPHTQECKDS